MITLYQYPPAFGLPNASPFCMKLETWLRIAGVEYENQYISDPRKAPKKKLPYIVDNEHVVADSALIIDYMREQHDIDLDAHLTPEQKAISHAVITMLEEHVYWSLVYSRWCDERNWPTIKGVFFDHLPPVVKSILPNMVRKGMFRQLHEHGMGRHTEADVYELGKKGIDAVATLLGNSYFMMGDKLSTVDAVVYAFMANLLLDDLPSSLHDAAVAHRNLIEYCQRMKEQYF